VQRHAAAFTTVGCEGPVWILATRIERTNVGKHDKITF